MMDSEGLKDELQRARAESARLRTENARLRRENARLRERSSPPAMGEHLALQLQLPDPSSSPPPVTGASSDQEKIALVRGLFRGRQDVYAVRWERSDGRAGYAPASRSREDRERRIFLPLTDEALRDHLSGRQTIGVYPLLEDDSCWFLAADFDKAHWREDVTACLAAADSLGVPAALERSRSGNGAHVWIFFDAPVAAAQARKLGCALLTLAMEHRHQIGLDSYDRLFPSQDTLPKGGFGNLIALPLQRTPRRHRRRRGGRVWPGDRGRVPPHSGLHLRAGAEGGESTLWRRVPRQEMEEERWRVAFVHQQLSRALEDMETFRICQGQMRQAQAAALPRLREQAQRCINRAVQLLGECCPPLPRPSPLRVPSPV